MLLVLVLPESISNTGFGSQMLLIALLSNHNRPWGDALGPKDNSHFINV